MKIWSQTRWGSGVCGTWTSQHQVKRRRRVEMLLPASAASRASDVVWVAHVMKVRKVAAGWVLRVKEGLQCVQRQRGCLWRWCRSSSSDCCRRDIEVGWT